MQSAVAGSTNDLLLIRRVALQMAAKRDKEKRVLMEQAESFISFFFQGQSVQSADCCVSSSLFFSPSFKRKKEKGESIMTGWSAVWDRTGLFGARCVTPVLYNKSV